MVDTLTHQGLGYYLEGIDGIDDLLLDQDIITINLYVIGNKSKKSSGYSPTSVFSVDRQRYKELFDKANTLGDRLSFHPDNEQLKFQGELVILELNLRAIKDIVFEANKRYSDECMLVANRDYARQLEAQF